jgi:hypothetical protein
VSVKAGVHDGHAPAVALERVVALRLSLDGSAEDNGPLRVPPGTESRGVLTTRRLPRWLRRLRPWTAAWMPAASWSCGPLIVHASSKAVSGRLRRVLHIEYTESLDIGSGVRLAIV